MESLWLLIPLSALLVLLIIALFGWAIHRGQFEELDGEGERILQPEPLAGAVKPTAALASVDADQARRKLAPEQSREINEVVRD